MDARLGSRLSGGVVGYYQRSGLSAVAMPFTTGPVKVETQDGRRFKLLEPVVYVTFVRGDPFKIVLPTGMETDGASIPQACWAIPGFQPFGAHWKAAVVHDGGYQGVWGTDWSREEVDAVFLEAMSGLGVDLAHRTAIHRAVREFGQAAFDLDREIARNI